MIELDDVILELQAKVRTLETEKAALVRTDATPEEIAHKQWTIASVTMGLKVMIAQAELDRTEKHRAEVYAQWYPLACELNEKIGPAEHRQENARLEYETSERNVDIIETALADHHANKPRAENFPSAKKNHQWSLRLRHLEEEREKRKQHRIEAKNEMENATTNLKKLRGELAHAAQTARLYAPRDPAAVKASQPIPVAWTLPSAPPSRIKDSPV
jgi:hypothetical protein